MNSQVEIENVSNDSRSIVNAQCNNLALRKSGGRLIKVDAYTRQIFANVSAESTSDWSPEITFYAVPELGIFANCYPNELIAHTGWKRDPTCNRNERI